MSPLAFLARSSSRLGTILPIAPLSGFMLAAAGAATSDPVSPSSLRPLAVTPSDRVGFVEVSARASGIQFTNRLPRETVTRNRNLTLGSGVAIGDADGDGLVDLFFASLTTTNSLYRNLGGWRFEDVTPSAGISHQGWASTGASFSDPDGDGDLDLFVTTLGNGVQYYRNLGAGRFALATMEAGLASRSGSTTIALADVEGDGDLDLYLVNYGAESVLASGGEAEVRRVQGEWVFSGPHAHRLRLVDGRVEEVGEAGILYLNDGQGVFRVDPPQSGRFLGTDGRPKPLPPDYGLGAQLRDIDGDGFPDLYVCNDFQMPDRLWLNDGSGRFREAPFQSLRKFSFSSMGVDFGDLDRDGNLDFFVVEMASRDYARAARQLSGLTPLPNIPGRFDLRPQVVRNTLFRSHGDGSWSEIAEFAGLSSTDWSWQPVFLDVDLDGFEDILVVNGTQFDLQDRDTLARIQSLGRQPPTAGRTNLLLYPAFPSPNVAFRNRGQFAFEDVSAKWGFTSTRVSTGIALGDLDGDGDADVVVNCVDDGPLLYRNDGDAPRLSVRLSGRTPNTRGIGALVEVEGGPVVQHQEIVDGGRFLSGDDAFRTFATGSATQLVVRVTWRSGMTTIVSNVPPNTALTVRETNLGRSPPRTRRQPEARPWFQDASAILRHRHTERGFDDFARQPLLPKQLGSLGPAVAWCDLDDDGRDELVVGTGRGGNLGIFRFVSDTSAVPAAVSLESDWIAPDDVAGFTSWITTTGRPGLLMAVSGYENSGVPTPKLWELRFDTVSGRAVVESLRDVPPLPASPGPIAAADFDADGDLDLFVGARILPGAYPRADASILLRREGSRFLVDPDAAPFLESVGMVTGATWSDLEMDGFPELILVSEWGPPRILSNSRGRLSPWDPPVSRGNVRIRPAPLSEFTGWWQAVSSADFDGDGRLDLAVANWGLNTGYRASKEHPLLLYHGNLSGSGQVDLVEAYYAETAGRYVPRRSLNALRQAFPFLSARFPTHGAFADSGLDDWLPALPIPPAVVATTTLESMVFLNTSRGFVARLLPAEAQYAPAFGITAADIDGDGNQDLFLAQNFFATRVEWPRCDAGRGLWLRGTGTGDFRPVEARSSGIRILGEQRGAALGDFDQDGRPDLAVAQNGAATTLWRNTEPTPGLRVSFTGPAGNPRAIGTLVRVADGTAPNPIQEIRAASGYWSVNSASVYFPSSRRPGLLEVVWPGGARARYSIPPDVTHFRIPAPRR